MKLVRNFFYAVGAVVLIYMYSANPATATFADLVRLVQSESARTLTVIVTMLLWALDIATSGFGEAVCVSISLPRSEKVHAVPATPDTAAGKT